MTVKQWNVGDVLAAADMNLWTVPIVVIKPSDTARNNTTTMTNDPDLVLPVAASSTYHINGLILYDGPTAGASDLKSTFTIPAGASGMYFALRQGLGGGFAGNQSNNWTDTVTSNTIAVGTIMNLSVKGILVVGGTAGNLTLQWAQNTANATNTHIKAQSFLTAQRIA